MSALEVITVKKLFVFVLVRKLVDVSQDVGNCRANLK